MEILLDFLVSFLLAFLVSFLFCFMISNILDEDEKNKCGCIACNNNEPGGLSEEYASKYPDCKRNIYNRKD